MIPGTGRGELFRRLNERTEARQRQLEEVRARLHIPDPPRVEESPFFRGYTPNYSAYYHVPRMNLPYIYNLHESEEPNGLGRFEELDEIRGNALLDSVRAQFEDNTHSTMDIIRQRMMDMIKEKKIEKLKEIKDANNKDFQFVLESDY